MNKNTKFQGLTSYELKWIALVTMLIDHVGVVLLPQVSILRIVGRLSFPIFAFLVAEGFRYTHDIRKYMFRMFVFALLSEIPFDLAISGTAWNLQRQNVMFTFLLALGMMKGWQFIDSKLVQFLVLAGTLCMAHLMHTDYDFFGVALVLFFSVCSTYTEKYKKVMPVLYNLAYGGIQCFGVFSGIPLLLYNGKEGKKMKYFFYIFYPAHLLILFLIKKYIN